MKLFTLSFFIILLFSFQSSFAQKKGAETLPDSIARMLPNCSFQMEGIQTSNDGKYMVVSGLRNCKTAVFREVSIYKSGTFLNSSICNTFLTTNMEPVKLKWIGDKLYIYQPKYKKAMLKEELVFDNVQVVYPNSPKSFY